MQKDKKYVNASLYAIKVDLFLCHLALIIANLEAFT